MPKLTATYVEKIKAPTQRVELPDSILPGFYLVLQASGHKAYAVRYRHAGRTRKLTLGTTAVLPLALARDRAREALQTVAAGRDPAIEKKQAQAGHGSFVSHVATLFLERHVRPNLRPRSVQGVEHALTRYVLPAIGGRRIQNVTRRDIIALLDAIVDAGKGVTANRTHATLSTFFRWAVERSIIEVSPVTGVRRPASERSRERVLSDAELATVWRASDQLEYPIRQFLQLLALTGQRRREVAGMRWSEINGEIWTIPAERSKNGRAHEVPLSAAVQSIIASAPKIAESDFVLIGRAGSFSAFDPTKKQIDAIARVEGWTFHDLRRTMDPVKLCARRIGFPFT